MHLQFWSCHDCIAHCAIFIWYLPLIQKVFAQAGQVALISVAMKLLLPRPLPVAHGVDIAGFPLCTAGV